MRKQQQNHYEILGISPTVSTLEIKRAYRELVKKCHPDLEYRKQSAGQRVSANEKMRSINLAYETLMDYSKRAAFDYEIGARRARVRHRARPTLDNEAEVEKYLKQVFNPARRKIIRKLNLYKKKLTELSQDIYDEELLEDFTKYVLALERTLREASYDFTESPPPPSLTGAVQWMRHSIAQAADGLEELHEFCQNFDYDHLSMAGNLFNISKEHAKEALRQSKNR